jgi:hypothetical protein
MGDAKLVSRTHGANFAGNEWNGMGESNERPIIDCPGNWGLAARAENE